MIQPYSSIHHADCLTIFNSNCPKFFMPDEQHGLELWLHGQSKNKLAYGNTIAEHFFVLEENSAILGCGGYYIKQDKPEANLVWGMVHANHHYEGLGTLLYKYRLNHIQQNYPTCALILDTSQHTYKFYEKMGLSVNAIIENGYGAGLDRYDMG